MLLPETSSLSVPSLPKIESFVQYHIETKAFWVDLPLLMARDYCLFSLLRRYSKNLSFQSLFDFLVSSDPFEPIVLFSIKKFPVIPLCFSCHCPSFGVAQIFCIDSFSLFGKRYVLYGFKIMDSFRRFSKGSLRISKKRKRHSRFIA